MLLALLLLVAVLPTVERLEPRAASDGVELGAAIVVNPLVPSVLSRSRGPTDNGGAGGNDIAEAFSVVALRPVLESGVVIVVVGL